MSRYVDAPSGSDLLPGDRPGDRYLYQPIGHRGPHWHEVIRWERGIDLPVLRSRCLGKRDCGTF